jgi:hypothetical protein
MGVGIPDDRRSFHLLGIEFIENEEPGSTFGVIEPPIDTRSRLILSAFALDH